MYYEIIEGLDKQQISDLYNDVISTSSSENISTDGYCGSVLQKWESSTCYSGRGPCCYYIYYPKRAYAEGPCSYCYICPVIGLSYPNC